MAPASLVSIDLEPSLWSSHPVVWLSILSAIPLLFSALIFLRSSIQIFGFVENDRETLAIEKWHWVRKSAYPELNLIYLTPDCVTIAYHRNKNWKSGQNSGTDWQAPVSLVRWWNWETWSENFNLSTLGDRVQHTGWSWPQWGFDARLGASQKRRLYRH